MDILNILVGCTNLTTIQNSKIVFIKQVKGIGGSDFLSLSCTSTCGT